MIVRETSASTGPRLTLSYNGGSYTFSSSRTNGSSPLATDSGEIIIELDWRSLSGKIFNSYASTYNVGWAVSQLLMFTNAVPELNGHSLAEFPIHLIGHSRGGSLMSQISYVLGTKRRRAAALQNAVRNTVMIENREASWTAPALWRFAGI
jgi:hypothetical protein